MDTQRTREVEPLLPRVSGFRSCEGFGDGLAGGLAGLGSVMPVQVLFMSELPTLHGMKLVVSFEQFCPW